MKPELYDKAYYFVFIQPYVGAYGFVDHKGFEENQRKLVAKGFQYHSPIPWSSMQAWYKEKTEHEIALDEFFEQQKKELLMIFEKYPMMFEILRQIGETKLRTASRIIEEAKKRQVKHPLDD